MLHSPRSGSTLCASLSASLWCIIRRPNIFYFYQEDNYFSLFGKLNFIPLMNLAMCDIVYNVKITRKCPILSEMSRVVRKTDFCICENKDADQLRGNREADQRLCFRYIDSTIPQVPKSEISSLYPSCVIAQPGLCGTWSETPKTGFLRTRLKYN